ncbi:HAMP domain-containing protein [bacterium]|nr:HAMP domain-containing protein [bacterium]
MIPAGFRFPLPLRTKAILLVIVWQVGAFTAFSALKTLAEYRGARTMLTEATRLSARCIGHACSMSLESEGMDVLGKILAAATKEHGEDVRYLFVVSTDGQFLAGMPSDDSGLAARVEKIPAHHDLRELDDPDRYRGAFLDFSVPVRVADRPFGVLHVGVGDQNIRHRLLQSLQQDALIIFLALLGGGLIALFIDWRLRRSLRSLLHVTREMSHGDLSRRVDIRTGDELQTLGESFNQMADALAKSRAELEKETESKLIQADKMAGLGLLAGGVAHELGNPLGSIYMEVKLLEEDPQIPPKTKQSLEYIRRDVVRCREIIQNLLDFSRRSPGEREPADLPRLLESAWQLCKHEIEKNSIVVEKDFAPAVPPCVLDRNQMLQVFVNLIQNAAQAQPGGGRIFLGVRRSGEQVEIEITDSGPGIPEEIRTRLFEPFFTTKPRGTGLGLSICHGIVKEHGGTIDVTSRRKAEAAPGTTFLVTLPAAATPTT